MASSSQAEDQYLQSSYTYGTSPLSADSLEQPLKTFLFGYPLGGTLAPLLHSTLFQSQNVNWTYDPLESADGNQFLVHLRSPGVIGCAVTMPYKVRAISEVDEVTDEGHMIGAINTVFIRKDTAGKLRYIGTNTDCIGIREAFMQNFPGVSDAARGKPALILGAGGACRAAIYTLWKGFNCSSIYIVNRLESEFDVIVEEFSSKGFEGQLEFVNSVDHAESLDTPVLIVGTVPDYPPVKEGEILARDIAKTFLARKEKGYVLEMCYHPNPWTTFLDMAKKSDWNVLDGTEAMIYQGIAQQILWTEKPQSTFSLAKTRSLIKEELYRRSAKAN